MPDEQAQAMVNRAYGRALTSITTLYGAGQLKREAYLQILALLGRDEDLVRIARDSRVTTNQGSEVEATVKVPPALAGHRIDSSNTQQPGSEIDTNVNVLPTSAGHRTDITNTQQPGSTVDANITVSTNSAGHRTDITSTQEPGSEVNTNIQVPPNSAGYRTNNTSTQEPDTKSLAVQTDSIKPKLPKTEALTVDALPADPKPKKTLLQSRHSGMGPSPCATNPKNVTPSDTGSKKTLIPFKDLDLVNGRPRDFVERMKKIICPHVVHGNQCPQEENKKCSFSHNENGPGSRDRFMCLAWYNHEVLKMGNGCWNTEEQCQYMHGHAAHGQRKTAKKIGPVPAWDLRE
ncbi:hypothetical protein F4778DRAFT_756812 [Xylariomycetidae sp. FL2044]|nr:hypothetical protein F4778DRAFT_756812 [Xylariomycetidae sp. FL2044]